MSYTLFELLFISLFSAILSLAFDNLFNSPLGCTSSASQRFSSIPASLGSSMVEDTFADSLCGRQTALVTLVFVSLGLYLAVLVVSLFRIFDKVARKYDPSWPLRIETDHSQPLIILHVHAHLSRNASSSVAYYAPVIRLVSTHFIPNRLDSQIRTTRSIAGLR